MSPPKRHRLVVHLVHRIGVSERQACRVLGQARSTQRLERTVPDDVERLTEEILGLATKYGRDGYRRATALLFAEGLVVNHRCVERIWRWGACPY